MAVAQAGCARVRVSVCTARKRLARARWPTRLPLSPSTVPTLHCFHCHFLHSLLLHRSYAVSPLHTFSLGLGTYPPPPLPYARTHRYQLMFPQPGVDRKFVWGGACMGFQREPRGTSTAARDKETGLHGGDAAGTFLVGTEGGKIFKCYNDANDVNTKVCGSRRRGRGLRCFTRTYPHEMATQHVPCSLHSKPPCCDVACAGVLACRGCG